MNKGIYIVGLLTLSTFCSAAQNNAPIVAGEYLTVSGGIAATTIARDIIVITAQEAAAQAVTQATAEAVATAQSAAQASQAAEVAATRVAQASGRLQALAPGSSLGEIEEMIVIADLPETKWFVHQYDEALRASQMATDDAAITAKQAEAAAQAAQKAKAAQGPEAAATASKGLSAAGIAVVVIVIIVLVAVVTMPYWLPEIVKQSGMANNTLYEAHGYIDFQGAAGSSCDRANFGLYPYSRKDLEGRIWKEVGGDRGRACLPERYAVTINIPSGGAVTKIYGTKKDMGKHIKVFTIQYLEKGLSIIWRNA